MKRPIYPTDAHGNTIYPRELIVDECREAITAEASEADVLGWAILRQLASEWSTHPDYEAGWAP